MSSGELSQARLSFSQLLLELIIKLFTIGIFSVEGGAKAWFEIILVSAALCASGYLLWWQIPLLIIAIILGTFAAGMFSLLAPYYKGAGSLTANHQIALAIKIMSEQNFGKISTLSGDELEQRLKQIYEAQRILEKHPKLAGQLVSLQSASNNINQTRDVAFRRAEVFRRAKEKKKQEEADLRKKEQEIYEKNLNKKSEREKWLNEQRRINQFTGGCPPDNRYSPPRCRTGYPIKVTLELDREKDGFDGIIWEPKDKKYQTITPQWCYQSIEEAENESGRYRFRLPEYKRKRRKK